VPIDSSANLLFNIGADSSNAEANVQRFRALLGKDLEDLTGEFRAWAEKIFGDLSTVSGAMTAVGAGLAALVVGVEGAALEAAHKYTEFVNEVARGSKTTGIGAENMSKLKFAAEATRTSYDALVTGLTRFASTIVKANEGSAAQSAAFARLGITQAQVKAGEQDMMPLLMQVADRFHAMGSAVERTAIARELFSRGGTELVKMLSQGSEGLKELGAEADKLGLVITGQDVLAVKEYQMSLQMLKAETEAFAVAIGRHVIPALENIAAYVLGMVESLKQGAQIQAGWADYATLGIKSWVDFFHRAGVNADAFKERIAKLAESLSKFGDESLDATGKVKEEWDGLVAVLDRVREATESGPSVDERVTKQFAQLQDAVAKATAKYDELRAAGKLTGEDAQKQAAALAALPAALSAFLGHALDEIHEKNVEAGARLQDELGAQQQKTMASEAAAWTRHIAQKREQMAKEKTDTEANLALLAELEAAGYDRIGREKAEAIEKAGRDIAAKTAAQGEKTRAAELAEWAQSITDERAALTEQEKLYGDNAAKLEAKDQAGRDRINREWDERYAREMTTLQGHLGRMLQAQMTHAERLREQYDRDLEQFGKAEEAKSLKTAKSEAERVAIESQFAALRKTLTDRYQQDLQALENSQGWQGVFGGKFGELLRGNEAMLRQWATSAQQSHLLVKYSLEMLDEVGQRTFEHFAQGMGGNIASAIVYSKSIGEAMRSALASTLESLAAEAMTYAIYSTALGFLRLAQWDPVGAENAFTSAAIWGAVGVASAVAGRAAAPSQNSSGASGTGSQRPGAGVSAGAGSPGSSGPGAPGGPHVTVNVWGHVYGTSGMAELASAMNDAVLKSGRDADGDEHEDGRGGDAMTGASQGNLYMVFVMQAREGAITNRRIWRFRSSPEAANGAGAARRITHAAATRSTPALFPPMVDRRDLDPNSPSPASLAAADSITTRGAGAGRRWRIRSPEAARRAALSLFAATGGVVTR